MGFKYVSYVVLFLVEQQEETAKHYWWELSLVAAGVEATAHYLYFACLYAKQLDTGYWSKELLSCRPH